MHENNPNRKSASSRSSENKLTKYDGVDKIWLRISGLEFCSWMLVYKNLLNAFESIGISMPASPFSIPEDVENYVELYWGDPAFWKWSNAKVKKRVGLALSEHRSLGNPERAIPNLQRCDLLIVPCISAAEAFYEIPLDIPIAIAPFGVDDTIYSYISRTWNEELRFLVAGVAQFRKGTWLAVEAFTKAFGSLKNQKNVSMTIASFAESPMLARLQREYKEYNNIRFVGKAKDIIDIYKEHHVLVSPHLAEGWGLMIPEAMATGMPCIVSRCSAPREYFSSKYGWWIEMSELYAAVDQCLPGVGGSWRLPSVNSLAEKLLYAYENRKECQDKGKQASKYVLGNLTWRQSAKKIVDVITSHP